MLRFAPGNQRIVGLTVLGALRILDNEGELSGASAYDLAPALAAV